MPVAMPERRVVVRRVHFAVSYSLLHWCSLALLLSLLTFVAEATPQVSRLSGLRPPVFDFDVLTSSGSGGTLTVPVKTAVCVLFDDDDYGRKLGLSASLAITDATFRWDGLVRALGTMGKTLDDGRQFGFEVIPKPISALTHEASSDGVRALLECQQQNVKVFVVTNAAFAESAAVVDVNSTFVTMNSVKKVVASNLVSVAYPSDTLAKQMLNFADFKDVSESSDGFIRGLKGAPPWRRFTVVTSENDRYRDGHPFYNSLNDLVQERNLAMNVTHDGDTKVGDERNHVKYEVSHIDVKVDKSESCKGSPGRVQGIDGWDCMNVYKAEMLKVLPQVRNDATEITQPGYAPNFVFVIAIPMEHYDAFYTAADNLGILRKGYAFVAVFSDVHGPVVRIGEHVLKKTAERMRNTIAISPQDGLSAYQDHKTDGKYVPALKSWQFRVQDEISNFDKMPEHAGFQMTRSALRDVMGATILVQNVNEEFAIAVQRETYNFRLAYDAGAIAALSLYGIIDETRIRQRVIDTKMLAHHLPERHTSPWIAPLLQSELTLDYSLHLFPHTQDCLDPGFKCPYVRRRSYDGASDTSFREDGFSLAYRRNATDDTDDDDDADDDEEEDADDDDEDEAAPTTPVATPTTTTASPTTTPTTAAPSTTTPTPTEEKDASKDASGQVPLTDTGKACHFPFKVGEEVFDNCTNKYTGGKGYYWCSTAYDFMADTENNQARCIGTTPAASPTTTPTPTEEKDTSKDASGQVPLTDTGKACHFPFKVGEEVFDNCTNKYTGGKGYYWCSTAYDFMADTENNQARCIGTTPAASPTTTPTPTEEKDTSKDASGQVPLTDTGKACHFPFKVGEEVFDNCTNKYTGGKGYYWCSTAYDFMADTENNQARCIGTTPAASPTTTPTPTEEKDTSKDASGQVPLTDTGKACHFPFKVGEEVFDNCTNKYTGGKGYYWCSTAYDFMADTENNQARCIGTTPAASPTTTPTPTEEKDTSKDASGQVPLTDTGKACHFPFKVGEEVFDNCTNKYTGGKGYYWCSTAYDFMADTENNQARCIGTTPAASPTTTPTPTEEKDTSKDASGQVPLTDTGKACHFPFKVGEEVFDNCTNKYTGGKGYYWCSTAYDFMADTENNQARCVGYDPCQPKDRHMKDILTGTLCAYYGHETCRTDNGYQTHMLGATGENFLTREGTRSVGCDPKTYYVISSFQPEVKFGFQCAAAITSRGAVRTVAISEGAKEAGAAACNSSNFPLFTGGLPRVPSDGHCRMQMMYDVNRLACQHHVVLVVPFGPAKETKDVTTSHILDPALIATVALVGSRLNDRNQMVMNQDDFEKSYDSNTVATTFVMDQKDAFEMYQHVRTACGRRGSIPDCAMILGPMYHSHSMAQYMSSMFKMPQLVSSRIPAQLYQHKLFTSTIMTSLGTSDIQALQLQVIKHTFGWGQICRIGHDDNDGLAKRSLQFESIAGNKDVYLKVEQIKINNLENSDEWENGFNKLMEHNCYVLYVAAGGRDKMRHNIDARKIAYEAANKTGILKRHTVWFDADTFGGNTPCVDSPLARGTLFLQVHKDDRVEQKRRALIEKAVDFARHSLLDNDNFDFFSHRSRAMITRAYKVDIFEQRFSSVEQKEGVLQLVRAELENMERIEDLYDLGEAVWTMVTKSRTPGRFNQFNTYGQEESTIERFMELGKTLAKEGYEGYMRNITFDVKELRAINSGQIIDIMQCGAHIGGPPGSAGVVGTFKLADRVAAFKDVADKFEYPCDLLCLNDQEMSWETPLTFDTKLHEDSTSNALYPHANQNFSFSPCGAADDHSAAAGERACESQGEPLDDDEEEEDDDDDDDDDDDEEESDNFYEDFRVNCIKRYMEVVKEDVASAKRALENGVRKLVWYNDTLIPEKIPKDGSAVDSVDDENSVEKIYDPSNLDYRVCPAGTKFGIREDKEDNEINTCKECDPGSYSPQPGRMTCLKCVDYKLGGYVNASGQAECTECPKNSRRNQTTPGLSISECLCERGFYQKNTSLDASNFTCEGCPSGAICNGGVVTPLPTTGRWGNYRCPVYFPDCPGGSGTCVGDGEFRCAVGHAGNLCERCLEGYGRQPGKAGRCRTCSKLTVQIVAYVASTMLSAVLSWLIVHTDMVGNTSDKPVYSQLIKIVITYIQIVTILIDAGVEWPDDVMGAKGTLSTASGDGGASIATSECLFDARVWDSNHETGHGTAFLSQNEKLRPYFGLYADMIRPGIAFGVAFIAVFLECAWYSFKVWRGDVVMTEVTWPQALLMGGSRRSRELNELNFSDLSEVHTSGNLPRQAVGLSTYGLYAWVSRMLPKVISAVAFVSWPAFTITTLSIFSCKPYDASVIAESMEATTCDSKSEFTMLWFPSQDEQCMRGNHLQYGVSVGIPAVLFVVVGVPAFLFVYLRRNKMRIKMSDPLLIFNFGFLFQDYESRFYYWESVILVQKLMLTFCVAVIKPFGAIYSQLILLGVTFLIYKADSAAEPYRVELVDKVNNAMLTCAFFTVYLSLFISDYINRPVKLLALVALLCLQIGFIAYVCRVLFFEFLEVLCGKLKDLDIPVDDEHEITDWCVRTFGEFLGSRIGHALYTYVGAVGARLANKKVTHEDGRPLSRTLSDSMYQPRHGKNARQLLKETFSNVNVLSGSVRAITTAAVHPEPADYSKYAEPFPEIPHAYDHSYRDSTTGKNQNDLPLAEVA